MNTIFTDQFIGEVFVCLAEVGIHEINTCHLSRLARYTDRIMRMNHDTMLQFTFQNMMSVIFNYRSFFTLNENRIILNLNSFENEQECIRELKQYFLGGLTIDVHETVAEAIRSYIKNNLQ